MKVSVCLASYNGGRYIADQLQSILDELDSGDEIIVSDDNSTDGTADLVRSAGDGRIKLVVNPNRGIVNNFENALRHASGEIIILSDQDDLWLPGRVKDIRPFFPDRSAVLCDCRVVNSDLSERNPSFFRFHRSRAGFFWNFIRNSYIGCCLAVSREVLQKALPFPPGIPWHDQWLGLTAELTGKTEFLDRVLVLYRRHEDIASPTASGKGYGLLKKFTMRMRLAGALVSRFLFRI